MTTVLARLYRECGSVARLAEKLGQSVYLTRKELAAQKIEVRCGVNRTQPPGPGLPKGIRQQQFAVPGSRMPGREVAVLAMAAEGRTSREIGDAMDLAENTIKTYLRRIMCRLEARDRTHAVVLAIRAGVLDPAGRVPGRRR